jgi:TPP-dependent pyruvate/acetoin dehydrogenase alpha subunit
MAINVKRETAAAQRRPERIPERNPERGTPLISPLITDDTLKQMYKAMLQCRALEERTRALSKRKSEVKSSAVGAQEAIVAGVAMNLRPDDIVAPSRGSFIADFVKGTPLHATLSAIDRLIAASSAGKVRSSSGRASPKVVSANDGTSNALIPPASVAAQLNIATGLALANKLRQTTDVVVVFIGGSWSSPAVKDEALHFAGVHRLPIIYVHDQRAADSAANTMKASHDASKAVGDYGFPSIPVDGNDLVAVYRVAHEAIKRARRGGGPTTIECKICRCHDQLNRDRSQTDPVMRMERYLAARKLFSQDWKRKSVNAFKTQLDAAVKRVRRT